MRISEIFQSIQGEGQLSGTPSIFIRTSGCNLRCRWCDTPYASWYPEGKDFSVPEILDEVARWPTSHVVLTGGEPMIAREIHELADCLRSKGKHITIETAGTIAPNGIPCDLASLSPKLSNSTPDPEMFGPGWTDRHESLRSQVDIVRSWVENYACQLKFVVSSTEDLAEIHMLVAPLVEKGLSPSQVLLMAEASEPDRLEQHQTWLIRTCLEHGFRFCDRLHLRLFGNTKGT